MLPPLLPEKRLSVSDGGRPIPEETTLSMPRGEGSP